MLNKLFIIDKGKCTITKNESQLDFSIFEDIKPFSFHGIIKNIFSALGHKYECLN